MTNLVTLVDARNWLGIDQADTSQDAMLTLLIEAISVQIQRYLNRDIEFGSFTEIHSGTNTRYLRLPHWPVHSVENVWADQLGTGTYGQGPNAFANPPLIKGVEYCLDVDQADGTSLSGCLVKINGVWPVTKSRTTSLLATGYDDGFGAIKVQYSGGFKTIPADLKLAALQTMARAKSGARTGAPLRSESTPEYSYQLENLGANASDLLDPVKPILAKFKHFSVYPF